MCRNEIVRDCVLTIGSQRIVMDLLVLDTPTYDVTFGMNWLTNNSIEIDCANRHLRISEKVVSLSTPLDIETMTHIKDLQVL